MSDFSGADPLIHRRNVTKVVDLGIRTERNDVKFLNEPHFVGSFRDDEVSHYYYLSLEREASRNCHSRGFSKCHLLQFTAEGQKTIF